MSRALVALAALISLLALPDGAMAEDPPQASPADVSSAVAIFGKLGFPSVKDKRFVCLNTGEHWESDGKLRFRYASGWLLDEQPNEVELLTTALGRLRAKRDRSLPPDWEKHKNAHPADLPLPGELTTIDFEKEAEDFATGSAERYFGFGAMEHASAGGLSRHAEACLF